MMSYELDFIHTQHVRISLLKQLTTFKKKKTISDAEMIPV